MREASHFHQLDLPLGMTVKRSKFSLYSTPLYRCRLIVICFALWSAAAVAAFRDRLAWKLHEHPFVLAYLIVIFLMLFFCRMYHSYMRVNASARAWSTISKSIASYADSVQSDTTAKGVSSLHKMAIHYLEELVVALHLREPQDSANRVEAILNIPEKHEAASPASQEGPILPRHNLLKPLRYLWNSLPKIPSRGAITPDDPLSDMVRTPQRLLWIDLFDVAVQIEQNGNDVDMSSSKDMMNCCNQPCGYVSGVVYKDPFELAWSKFTIKFAKLRVVAAYSFQIPSSNDDLDLELNNFF
ncbi:hypothetical protein ONZ45_g1909 [Pleurotus djamor]|nr:hypothetical protein ONZ45_g1909 [Pleurotus djamor]